MKRNTASRGTDGDNHQTQRRVPLELQQSVLDVFKNVFNQRFDGNLSSSIQTVKGHLFSRDFNKAFGDEMSLEAYAIRWSPSRALAYMDLICRTPQLLALFPGTLCSPSTVDSPSGSPIDRSHHPHSWHVDTPVHDIVSARTIITCLGGGAGAEVVALAGSLAFLSSPGSCATSPKAATHAAGSPSASGVSPAGLTVRILDMANWSSVVDRLHRGATTVLPIQENASLQPASNAHIPLVESDLFSISFEQQDILELEVTKALHDSALVTLTFTLNELYSTSMSKTTNFLLTLTSLTEPGTLLLVIDSPGSYSTVRVGSVSSAASEVPEKKYPMHWLLGHTLLEESSFGGSRNVTQKPQWEKVVSKDSMWFRRSEKLTYPIELEDMRYQYHLYRRI